jgi:hypothetical protein
MLGAKTEAECPRTAQAKKAAEEAAAAVRGRFIAGRGGH